MIAILLATYNGSKYLPELMDSLFAQTCQDFTVYVHDDGSSDNTCDIIAEYASRYPGRVQILWGPATGSPKGNFMWMLSQVEADYYMFCDQDDVWLDNKIEVSLAELKKITSESIADECDTPVLIFSDMMVVDEHLVTISNSFVTGLGRSVSNTRYTQVLIDNPAAGCTMLFNHSLRDIVIQCPDIDAIPMHDVWVLMMADIFGRVKGLKQCLVKYRQTGHNIMGASEETDSDKVSRNTSDMMRGSFLKNKKAFVQEARDLAQVVLQVEKLPAKVRITLKDFVDIGKKNKLVRIIFYKKNGFRRARNNWWYYLWL